MVMPVESCPANGSKAWMFTTLYKYASPADHRHLPDSFPLPLDKENHLVRVVVAKGRAGQVCIGSTCRTSGSIQMRSQYTPAS